MVSLKKHFVAGMVTLAMTTTMATGIAQNSSFDTMFNSSSVITADAASIPTVYNNSGVTAKQTYMSNGDRKHQNNLNKHDSNIILVGDSRTCQLLNLDAKSGKKRFSGLGAWGQTYQRNVNTGINDKTTINVGNYSADSYIKTQIKSSLKSDKPLYIWVFGTINETYDTDASAFISYVKELRDYCKKQKASKKVVIYAVETVPGTSNWSAANKNVASYNNAISSAFDNGKADSGKVSIKVKNYQSIVYSYAPYCQKGKVYGYAYTSSANANAYTKGSVTTGYSSGRNFGTVTNKVTSNNLGYDDGLHYTVHTLEAMGNWILNNSK